MSDLLPENLDLPQCESSSFAIEGGAIVPITRVASKRKQEVTDILTWVECFTSYITVLTTYIPNRSRDLLSYMALIIRMAKRYSGNCWLVRFVSKRPRQIYAIGVVRFVSKRPRQIYAIGVSLSP